MKVEKQILSTFQFIEPQFNPSRAEEILKTFYSLLNEKKYEEALPYYGGDFSVLVGWNPVINPGDKISLLRNGCEENGLHCLRVKTVKKSLAISETESKFVVQLADADGSVFKIGPCCGATEKEMPPRSDFECIVRKVGNKYLVMDLPPYSP
jgi:hypothetical protein